MLIRGLGAMPIGGKNVIYGDPKRPKQGMRDKSDLMYSNPKRPRPGTVHGKTGQMTYGTPMRDWEVFARGPRGGMYQSEMHGIGDSVSDYLKTLADKATGGTITKVLSAADEKATQIKTLMLVATGASVLTALITLARR